MLYHVGLASADRSEGSEGENNTHVCFGGISDNFGYLGIENEPNYLQCKHCLGNYFYAKMSNTQRKTKLLNYKMTKTRRKIALLKYKMLKTHREIALLCNHILLLHINGSCVNYITVYFIWLIMHLCLFGQCDAPLGCMCHFWDLFWSHAF